MEENNMWWYLFFAIIIIAIIIKIILSVKKVSPTELKKGTPTIAEKPKKTEKPEASKRTGAKGSNFFWNILKVIIAIAIIIFIILKIIVPIVHPVIEKILGNNEKKEVVRVNTYSVLTETTTIEIGPEWKTYKIVVPDGEHRFLSYTGATESYCVQNGDGQKECGQRLEDVSGRFVDSRANRTLSFISPSGKKGKITVEIYTVSKKRK